MLARAGSPESAAISANKALLAIASHLVPRYLKLIGGAPLSGKGANWLVITPDDKTVYVANPEANNVSVVDIATMKETAVIPVGFAPSRNTCGLPPGSPTTLEGRDQANRRRRCRGVLGSVDIHVMARNAAERWMKAQKLVSVLS